MSELVEFEKPGNGDVFQLVEAQIIDAQGLVELAFTGTDFEPLDEHQLEEIWGSKHGFSGSWRYRASYDPALQSSCAVVEMQSLEQESEELTIVIDPHKTDDPGVLIIEPGKTQSGHWLGVVWEDLEKNYLVDLEHGIVYCQEESVYIPIKGRELAEAQSEITSALSAVIDDVI